MNKSNDINENENPQNKRKNAIDTFSNQENDNYESKNNSVYVDTPIKFLRICANF